MLEGRINFQRDLDRLGKWVNEIQQEFRQSPSFEKDETLVALKAGVGLAEEQRCKDGQHENMSQQYSLVCWAVLTAQSVIIGWLEGLSITF